MARWIDKLVTLDRRWIFLLMGLAVLLPVLMPYDAPEQATPITINAFNEIENLPEGSLVLLAFDYDPGSAPELQPMATALTWHAAKKNHKLLFVALWPLGAQMVEDTISSVLRTEFPEMRYGEDFVNLGYKVGQEVVIRLLTTNLREAYSIDHLGNSVTTLPLTRDLTTIQNVDLIVSVSAGQPGTKEWVQYAATPYNIRLIAGCTGVQSPLLYPYYPTQMQGLLGAIKGAAEYEAHLMENYPPIDEDGDGVLDQMAYGFDSAGEPINRYRQGLERMWPQLFAHVLILVLIVFGNIILFLQRQSGGRVR